MTSQRIPPELIERWRRTGLRLDREGRLWHEGSQVTHPRLRRAILSWLDRDPDGHTVIRLGPERHAEIEIEDTELLATSARWSGDRALLHLNDGSEEELRYHSLVVGDDHALYCRVRGGRLEARLTTPAYYVIADRIAETADGEFVLAAAGATHLLGRRQR